MISYNLVQIDVNCISARFSENKFLILNLLVVN